MISLRIKNTKTFMSHLLVKDTFDNFLLSEADIKTSCSHSIDGQINRAFYSDEEWETLEGDARSLSVSVLSKEAKCLHQ